MYMHFGITKNGDFFYLPPLQCSYHLQHSHKCSWYKKSNDNFTVVILEMSLLHQCKFGASETAAVQAIFPDCVYCLTTWRLLPGFQSLNSDSLCDHHSALFQLYVVDYETERVKIHSILWKTLIRRGDSYTWTRSGAIMHVHVQYVGKWCLGEGSGKVCLRPFSTIFQSHPCI